MAVLRCSYLGNLVIFSVMFCQIVIDNEYIKAIISTIKQLF